MLNKWRKFSFVVIGILFLFNFLAWSAVYDLNRPDFLEINFFDVGQGDSTFIETPEGYQILIDGGPSSKVLEKLGAEMPFWDRTIDLIISSHPDPDHLLGLIDVLKNYKVGMVLTNGTVSSRPEFSEFKNQISKNKVSYITIRKNQKIIVGKNLSFEILAPLEDFEGREVSDFNTSSIVARMVYGNNAFLFTGDTSKSIEEKLTEENIDLNADVLKVAHHGSKTAENEDFIKAVNPEIAVIQVGLNNQYGHPHQEILDLLNKYGIRTLSTSSSRTLNSTEFKILRTDKDGDIKILSDGENLKVITQK